MGSLISNILAALIPALVKALVDRFFPKKSDQAVPTQTAEQALLTVATEQAEVQDAVNKINSKPKSVSGAIAGLRKRSKPSDGSHS